MSEDQKIAAPVVDYKTMNIYQKLNEVSKVAVYIRKSEEGFKGFKYASSAELLAIIRPKMQEVGLFLKFKMESVELVTRPNLPPFPLVKLSYTWINTDNPSETDTSEMSIFEDKMSGCQAIGSLLTYAERYFLYKFFQVPTDEDAPEQYYKKNNISAKISEQESTKNKQVQKKAPVVESKVAEVQDFSKMADDLWRMIRQQNPGVGKVPPEELQPYLENLQKNMPNSDIRTLFDKWAGMHDRLMAGMYKWYEEEGFNEEGLQESG